MNFNDFKRRNQNLMFDFMAEYHKERMNEITPKYIELSKHDYIIEWLKLFDESFANDLNNRDSFVSKLMNVEPTKLEKAFTWTNEHFAELDLGGNMAWHGVIESLLFKKSFRLSKSIYRDCAKETRWYGGE